MNKTKQTKINAGNRRRGKTYERMVAIALGGVRNLDKSRPHTDVETQSEVYEVKSTQDSVPQWIDKAMGQCEKAANESQKKMGGIVKVWTGGQGHKARAFLIQEIELYYSYGNDPDN